MARRWPDLEGALPITHGSVVFTWNGKTIYVDPYGGAEAYAGLAAPDLILITDIHGDHLDPKTLAALSVGKALMVMPKAVAEKLPAEYKARAPSGQSKGRPHTRVRVVAGVSV